MIIANHIITIENTKKHYPNHQIPVLDKSLDLEKFSKRNYSWFSLSSWRSEFSRLVLLSIFKILRNHFSFSSWFTRFLIPTSLSPLDFQDFVEQFLFLLSIFKIL